MAHGETAVTDFNSDKLRNEMANRGFTMGEMAKRAGIHVNTLANSLRSGRCEIGTLRRIVYVLETVPPIVGIVAIRQAPRKLAADPRNMVATPLSLIEDHHRIQEAAKPKAP
jgi:lambda repressor-like predicted transcriptional regulator